MYGNNQIKVGKFAEMCGISVITLQKLDREHIVPARRTDTNRRYYLYEDYQKYIDLITKRKLQRHHQPMAFSFK